jgi:hypothetical protein
MEPSKAVVGNIFHGKSTTDHYSARVVSDNVLERFFSEEGSAGDAEIHTLCSILIGGEMKGVRGTWGNFAASRSSTTSTDTILG